MSTRQKIWMLVLALLIPTTANQSASSQGFGGPRSQNAISQPSISGFALIDDTQLGRPCTSSGKIGRFSITLCRDYAILLDSMTGSTWLLVPSDAPGQPVFRWIPIPQKKGPAATMTQETDDAERKCLQEEESESFDPFRE